MSPVNKLRFRDEEVSIGDGGSGQITMKLYDTLTGSQVGKLDDPMGWIVKVK